MSGINTAIALQDRMTGTLNRITASIYSTVSAFERVDTVSEQAFNPSGVQAITREIYDYEQRIRQVESELMDANNQIRKMQVETDKASAKADDLNNTFKNITKTIGALGIGHIVATQVSQAVDYASDLVEVQNVVDTVFGEDSAIDEWSQRTLRAFGLNELAAKQYAGTLGAMLSSAGMTGGTVEELSMKMTELAGDMASFYNLSADEAFTKIRSGLSGETEPLKALGIDMSVAGLEAYALAQNIKKPYEEMSQGEKMMLRYGYMLQQTKNAQGDFSDNFGSYSNQVKYLKQSWQEFTGSLATNVLPALTGLVGILNNGISFLEAISAGVERFSGVLSVIEPLLWGVVGVMGVYLAVTKGAALATALLETVTKGFTAIQTFFSIGWGVLTGNTAAASAAQFVYNSALLACPLTWIIMLIIAAIAVIYGVVAAINALTGSTISATGVIIGAVATLGAFLWNTIVGTINGIIQAVWSIFVEPFIGIIEWLLNAINGGFDGLGGAVANLLGQIISWCLSLVKVITNIIDAVFGTDWTSGLTDLQNKVTSWGKTESAISISHEAPTLGDIGIDRIAYGDAWDAGYNLGEGIDNKVSSLFGGTNIEKDLDSLTDDYVPNMEDLMNQVAGNTEKTASISDENLAYMRDLAEQDAINKFTTAEIKLDMVNNNSIASSMDIDGIVTQLSEGLREAMESAAEGVYA